MNDLGKQEIFTIELDANGDVTNRCSYHIASLKTTIENNILACVGKQNIGRWVLVGLAFSHDEAKARCQEIRTMLCKSAGKEEYGLDEILDKMEVNER